MFHGSLRRHPAHSEAEKRTSDKDRHNLLVVNTALRDLLFEEH